MSKSHAKTELDLHMTLPGKTLLPLEAQQQLDALPNPNVDDDPIGSSKHGLHLAECNGQFSNMS
jgi:hypothetical protein